MGAAGMHCSHHPSSLIPSPYNDWCHHPSITPAVPTAWVSLVMGPWKLLTVPLGCPWDDPMSLQSLPDQGDWVDFGMKGTNQGDNKPKTCPVLQGDSTVRGGHEGKGLLALRWEDSPALMDQTVNPRGFLGSLPLTATSTSGSCPEVYFVHHGLPCLSFPTGESSLFNCRVKQHLSHPPTSVCPLWDSARPCMSLLVTGQCHKCPLQGQCSAMRVGDRAVPSAVPGDLGGTTGAPKHPHKATSTYMSSSRPPSHHELVFLWPHITRNTDFGAKRSI